MSRLSGDDSLEGCVNVIADRLHLASRIMKELCDGLLQSELESFGLRLELSKIRTQLGLPALDMKVERKPACSGLPVLMVR